jgi:hypothetical protein
MTFLYTPPHSSGETKTGIPPVPTSLKERRSGRCQGRAAGPAGQSHQPICVPVVYPSCFYATTDAFHAIPQE